MRLIRPKYKVVPHITSGSVYGYNIAKRRLYLFYQRLWHYKIVQYKSGGCATPSREYLVFPTVDEAAYEIARLVRGEGRIVQRFWKNGRCVRTIRKRR